MFYEIKSPKDVEEFIDKTNALHDGEIMDVRFSHTGISKDKKGGYWFDPSRTKLTLQILVTSLWDAVIEIEFEDLLHWQVKGSLYTFDDIIETHVKIDSGLSTLSPEQDWIIWSDDTFTTMEDLKDCSYVIAKSMKWRIVEDVHLPLSDIPSQASPLPSF